MKTLQVPQRHLYCSAPLNFMLTDHRRPTFGYQFGRISDVCRQYGIKIEAKNGYNKFSAPKMRLFQLMEKLHFANIGYSKVDPAK